MKLSTIVAICLIRVAGLSQDLPHSLKGTPLPYTNYEIRWSGSNINLPGNLWTYRVIPADFSPAIISNLLALCSLTPTDRTNLSKRADNNTALFVSNDGTRTLWIHNEWGAVEFKDKTVEDTKNPFGVPSEDVVIYRAKKLLPNLGINQSDLAKKEGSHELKTYFTAATRYYYKNNSKQTNVQSRGVYFVRSLDGLDFSGIGVNGGCRIDFGNESKISRLNLIWRKVERDKSHQTASQETLTKWLREGKGDLLPVPDEWGPINWQAVKKLTITKVTPYYHGERGREPQKFVHPFATLEATIDTGSTNLPIYINCPIIE